MNPFHLNEIADEIMAFLSQKELTLDEMDTIAAELFCRTTRKLMLEKEN